MTVHPFQLTLDILDHEIARIDAQIEALSARRSNTVLQRERVAAVTSQPHIAVPAAQVELRRNELHSDLQVYLSQCRHHGHDVAHPWPGVEVRTLTDSMRAAVDQERTRPGKTYTLGEAVDIVLRDMGPASARQIEAEIVRRKFNMQAKINIEQIRTTLNRGAERGRLDRSMVGGDVLWRFKQPVERIGTELMP